jgi:hypothetical protein
MKFCRSTRLEDQKYSPEKAEAKERNHACGKAAARNAIGNAPAGAVRFIAGNPQEFSGDVPRPIQIGDTGTFADDVQSLVARTCIVKRDDGAEFLQRSVAGAREVFREWEGLVMFGHEDERTGFILPFTGVFGPGFGVRRLACQDVILPVDFRVLERGKGIAGGIDDILEFDQSGINKPVVVAIPQKGASGKQRHGKSCHYRQCRDDPDSVGHIGEYSK